MFQRLVAGVERALPGQCAVCRAWPARSLCESCVARFAQPRPRCVRCALPVVPGIATCGRCLVDPSPLDACYTALSYDYPWSSLIAQYKFHGQAGWARVFATLMRSTPWIEPALDDAELVLPMPLARERLVDRGINQSLRVARLLAPSTTDATLLLRIRNTPAQSALARKTRRADEKGAFAHDPLRPDAVRGQRVVLVDDVMTSGASLHEAARVLRAAGASRITALVLARTDEPGA